MDNQKYNVIFKGDIVEGSNVEEAKLAVASIFKANVNNKNIKALFSGERKVIKKNIDLEMAKKIKTQFYKAGAICFIEKQQRENVTSPKNSKQPNDIPEANAPKTNFEGNQNPNKEKRIVFSAVFVVTIFAILSVLLVFYNNNSKSDGKDNIKNSIVNSSSSLWMELIKARHNKTDLQWKKIVKETVGKEVIWTGYVFDVTRCKSGNCLVFVYPSPTLRPNTTESLGITLVLGENAEFRIPKEVASFLEKGQKIKFKGIINDLLKQEFIDRWLKVELGDVEILEPKYIVEKLEKLENQYINIQKAISDHAHIIDKHFLHIERLARNLANNAIHLIQEPKESNERFYWMSEFNNSGEEPPDYDYAPFYEKKVSINYPVVKPAPGVERDSVAPLMKRLAPLRYYFKQTLIDSRTGSAAISEAEAHRLLTVHGVPIRWAYIGLEAGVMYSYPGKGTYSDNYDPRKRPWYALGKGHQDVRWGNPYFDIQGHGLVLPCATSLIDSENRFYGVIGMDVTFSDIIKDQLNRPDAVGVVESFLLDNKGRIVVRSAQFGRDMATFSGPALELKPFPVPKVLAAISEKESGIVEIYAKNSDRLVVYSHIKSLGWVYVEMIDSAQLRSSEN